MSTKTKFFTSAASGAPVLTGQAGSLLGLLDACLVTGYGLLTATSVVVAGGVATATFATPHSALADMVILVAGATPSGLNGEQRVIAHSGNTLTFPTAVADGTATGVITVRVAPLGWTNPFTSTNKKAYKMVDPQGTGFYLRVDDTGVVSVRAIGYESMTDVDNGFGLFPSAGQFAGGVYWSKSAYADSTPVAWRIVGDSRGFYLSVNNYGASSAYQTFYFGDIKSLKSNDPYACCISGAASSVHAQQNVYGHQLIYANYPGQYASLYLARAANAIGGSEAYANSPEMNLASATSYSIGAVGPGYPSPVDNGLILCPHMIWNNLGLRGYYPGIVVSPQLVNASFSVDDVITGTGALAGKKFITMKNGYYSANANQSVAFFDHTGDWVR